MLPEFVELIDYEAQIARDELDSGEHLKARDRKLGRRLKLKGETDKRQALRVWLRELKLGEGPWPGEALVRAYDAGVALVFLLGLLSGFGMIRSLLRYDGSEPVNVIPFLAIYGILQILLLIWYLGKALLARYAHRLPGGALLALLRDFANRYLQKRPQLFARAGMSEKALEAFRRRMKDLHGKLLMQHAWKVFQVFGLSFHLASLLGFLTLISFNDYTFAWRTTLNLDAKYFYDFTTLLSSPFSWAHESLRPGFALIEASQFNRYQKDFLGAPGQGLGSVGWWPFLASVIAFYGVLPRFLIWLQLKLSIRTYVKAWAFEDQKSEALWARLRSEEAVWESAGLEALREVPDQTLIDTKSAIPRRALLVLWRDVSLALAPLEIFLRERYALEIVGRLEAKGLAQESSEIVRALDKDQALVIGSDPFELPGEAIEKIRVAVREKYPKLPILFAPLKEKDGSIALQGDPKAWRHALQMYRDPYLGLLDESLS